MFYPKYPLAITIQQNCPHQKQTNILRLVIHYPHTVHLMATKAKVISIEVKTL